uniref:Anticodon-binding domain-containing protein n=1 Tax=Glossina brevipalpis TaxID=37001 RepID=A0A1A9WXC8_9MUSC
MKCLKQILNVLQKNKFLCGEVVDGNKIRNVEFAENGEKFMNELLELWRQINCDWVKTDCTNGNAGNCNNNEIIESRVSFLDCKDFQNQYLRCEGTGEIFSHPILEKSATVKEEPNRNVVTLKSTSCRKLISDYFVERSIGLEKLYNLQRERKIWWMRLSANPSRYFVEAYDDPTPISQKKCQYVNQSTVVKSRFAFGSEDIESITLAYPQYINFADSPICLIRSSINLEIASTALLLDALENTQRLLLSLNRKLAPFQCVVACSHEGEKLDKDLIDLCLHICHIIRKIGLRVYDRHIHHSNYISLVEELSCTDCLGIPYAILVEKDSLKTGLLKLRNRDSSLSETIHISDIKAYLFKIFT